MPDTLDQQARYSLWLCPEDSSASRIQSTINHLALKHQSLAFDPHMTVCSGLTDNLDEIELTLNDFANTNTPLVLAGVKFSYRAIFYQSLFIELNLSPHLKRFHKQALQALGHKPSTEFYPHVSLAYITPDTFNPAAEITQLSETLLIDTCYDRLKLIETSGEQKNWREITEIKLDGK